MNNTGGPAFPTQSKLGVNDTSTWITEIPGQSGMTLRDYFAAKALTDEVVVFHGGNKNAIANWCYGMADAMLKEREK